jgi:hypothetical protein
MKGVRVVLGADAVLGYAENRPSLGIHGAATVHWLELGPLSFLNEIGLTVAAVASSPGGARVEGYACPLSYEWSSDRTSLHAGLLGGVTQRALGGERGGFVGVGVSATWHVERARAGNAARRER